MTMKISVLAAVVFSALLASSISAQVKSVAAANTSGSQVDSETSAPAPTRARVLGQPTQENNLAPTQQQKTDFNHPEISRFRRTAGPAPVINNNARAGHTALKPNTAIANTPVSNSNGIVYSKPASVPTVPTQTYRVGIGDVLDIQLAGNAKGNSTLFTVLDNGVLEYPLLGNPVVVAGMTTNEVASLLRQRIKIFDNPNISVSVRDYASHTVSIAGLVAAPGTKVLRREAVPLYTVLAEALILTEGGQATITRKGAQPIEIDLKDSAQANTLVLPGDVIKVTAGPALATEFYFVGGEINSPGQKPFHAGLTLTQAVLASGGAKSSNAAKVRISRQGTDGRLTSTEYNLRKIQQGKQPDPAVQKGDRIELSS